MTKSSQDLSEREVPSQLPSKTSFSNIDQGGISYYKGRGALQQSRKKGNGFGTTQCAFSFWSELAMIQKI